jgi:twitching motility two-component system response regulator PilH
MAKILVAEDSSTDVHFLESVLSAKGHHLTVAHDGEEAERYIKGEPFDLYILDVVMPKKNGFQLCREIKRDERLKNMPVILLTSKNQESDRIWGEKQGADIYLTKPCEATDLLFAVNKCLSR